MGFHFESQILRTLRVSVLVLGLAVTLPATHLAHAADKDECTEQSDADKTKLKSDEKKWNDELSTKQDLLDLLAGNEPVTDDEYPGLNAQCDCRPGASGDCSASFWTNTMKVQPDQQAKIGNDITGGCMQIYMKIPNLQTIDASCYSAVSGTPGDPTHVGCGAVRRLVVQNQLKARIKALNKLVDGISDRRQKITQEFKDCRKECTDCGTRGATNAMQAYKPGIGDYIVNGLSAITPMVLGGMGMYENSQMLNSYSKNYGAYLNQCTTVGIPCGGPMPGMMGMMGGGFGMMGGAYGMMGGMPMMGMMSGGYGMLASGSIMTGGMGMMGGMMPGMMPSMGMMGVMPGMGMMTGGYGMMASGAIMTGGYGMMGGMMPGMMPGMGMMGMMPGMGMMQGGYGMMASGSIMTGGYGMMSGMMPGMMPGMMQGGLYGNPGAFTAGYGMPVYPYGTGFGSPLFPMGAVGGISGGMYPGMMGGMYPGMMGGAPGMMGGMYPGMMNGGGYPMVGQGGFMGPIGGMAAGGYGFASGGGGFGFASGGMAGGGMYNPQYSSMYGASAQQAMLQAQSSAQSQQDYMIAQQQLYSAQSRLYQMSAGGYGYGYSGGGLAGGFGGVAGGLGGGIGGAGARPF